ncbi:MAG: hypothetical protein Q7T14_05415 [Aestuariivirga sp.]|nr:hypothetical protein [Aestuariivirga sp.]
MLKRRTVIQTLFHSIVFGILSLVPYQLEQNGYAVNSALVAVGWITLTLSVLALMYSFLSVVASMMMLALLSIRGGVELLIKAGNPYRIVAWKEAFESYDEITQLHRKSLSGRNNNDA